MAESIRAPAVGAGMLAYLALTQDEPVEVALKYIKTAHDRLAWAIQTSNNPDSDPVQRKEAAKELAQLSLFLMGLASAADPSQKTPVNLKFTRRKGRPQKNIVASNNYRKAGRYILDQKAEGYLSASLEAAEKFGVDRSRAQAIASRIEREPEQLAAFMARMAFYRQARGRFEIYEVEEQKIYRAARRAVQCLREGAEFASQVAEASAETGLDETKMAAWIREVEFAHRLDRENSAI